MASGNVVSRLSSRLQPVTRNLTKTWLASELSQLKSSLHSQTSAPVRRIARLSRLPSELGSVGSMLPLLSAVALARLISSLSTESQSWGLVPQGSTLQEL